MLNYDYTFLLILLSVFVMTLGCNKATPPVLYPDTEAIDQAIRSGELGTEFTQRAKKVDNLYVREITDLECPYKIYSFSDYKSGYSILNYQGQLILLCQGFGGGNVINTKIQTLNDKKVMTYKFNVGSGLQYELSGKYILGSDKATWQTLSDIK